MPARAERVSLQERLASHPNHFDAMRLAFSFMVVFGHCFVITAGISLEHPWGDPTGDWIHRLTHGQVFGGTLGVDFFFLISGFLVTRSWQRAPGPGNYALRRVLRIYPAFLVVVCVGALLVGPWSIGPEPYFRRFQPLAFAQSALLLQQPAMPAVFLHNPLPNESNGSLWTIRYEATCYLMVALFGALGVYRRPWIVVGLFLATLSVAFAQVNGFPNLLSYSREIYPFGIPGMWPNLLCFFLAGMVLCLYAHRIPYDRRLAGLATAAVVVACFDGAELLLPVFGAYLIFYLALRPAPGLERLTRRGDLSYGVYLYAFLIQQSWTQAFPEVFVRSPYLLFAATVPPTLACAFLSWHWVEKRPLRWKRRRLEPSEALHGAVRSA